MGRDAVVRPHTDGLLGVSFGAKPGERIYQVLPYARMLGTAAPVRALRNRSCVFERTLRGELRRSGGCRYGNRDLGGQHDQCRTEQRQGKTAK
jgi:hypothetical protein